MECAEEAKRDHSKGILHLFQVRVQLTLPLRQEGRVFLVLHNLYHVSDNKQHQEGRVILILNNLYDVTDNKQYYSLR